MQCIKYLIRSCFIDALLNIVRHIAEQSDLFFYWDLKLTNQDHILVGFQHIGRAISNTESPYSSAPGTIWESDFVILQLTFSHFELPVDIPNHSGTCRHFHTIPTALFMALSSWHAAICPFLITIITQCRLSHFESYCNLLIIGRTEGMGRRIGYQTSRNTECITTCPSCLNTKAVPHVLSQRKQLSGAGHLFSIQLGRHFVLPIVTCLGISSSIKARAAVWG